MRQAGYLAAAGLFAMKNNVERLVEDHRNAKYFATEIANIDAVLLDPNSVQTNMVMIDTPDIAAMEVSKKCKTEGLLINAIGKNRCRAVFHLDVSKKEVSKAVDIIYKVLK